MPMEFMLDKMIWVLALEGNLTLDVLTARKLLGKDKIIGVSCNTLAQAQRAVQDGADYLGNSH